VKSSSPSYAVVTFFVIVRLLFSPSYNSICFCSEEEEEKEAGI
jgi:hypothetical protein